MTTQSAVKPINSGRFGKGNKGKPKGATNKVTREVKEMILMALDKAGGVDYLEEQARTNPGPFLTLVGKVLPLQVGNVPGEQFLVGTAWQQSAAFRKA
jgi:hypothetical protein